MSINKQEINPVKGMKDITGVNIKKCQYIENIITQIANQFNYQEIRTPVLEKINLYTRSVGEHSDIVSKELYQFQDLDSSILALRPEGTSSVIRAINANGIINNKTSKHYYLCSMYRRERPQMGRYREFKQFGCEFIGSESIYADIEILRINLAIFKKLNIDNKIKLIINSIGTTQNRKACCEALKIYMSAYKDQLSDTAKITLEKNTLRIYDSKEESIRKLLIKAPKIESFIDEKSKAKFKQIQLILKKLNINYKIDNTLVRGLDYYNDLVFEFKYYELGSQNTISAGGRYDSLNQILYQKYTPAVGFAMGIDRIMLILEKNNLYQLPKSNLIYAFSSKEYLIQKLVVIIQNLLIEELNIRIELDYNINNFSKAFKNANKLNAKIVIIYGENEDKLQAVTIKNMESGEQNTINFNKIRDYIIQNV